MRALLDVNVLIALHDRDHVHHHRVSQWCSVHADVGWASCPLTQNGCLRIMSLPAYPNAQPLPVLADMLRQSCATPLHAFWADDVSLLDTASFNHAHIHGPKQLTDLYLLALAVQRGGRLVTLDARIPLSAVKGARPEHLVSL